MQIFTLLLVESFCATCVIHQIHKAKQKYIRTTVKMLFSSGNICSADLCFALSWEFDRNANVGLTKCMTRLHHLSLAHYFPILQTLICMVVCSAYVCICEHIIDLWTTFMGQSIYCNYFTLSTQQCQVPSSDQSFYIIYLHT